MGGTPALFRRMVAGTLLWPLAGRMRLISLEAKAEMEGDFVWRYARM
jgi:hypothetical protein